MPYKTRCHHHFIESEEEGILVPEDGIEILEAGTAFQRWSDCGHIHSPLDIQEKSESHVKDKRNYPMSPAQLYMNSMDFS